MKAIEHLSNVFTPLLVRKIESFEGTWSKPWVGIKNFTPQNLRGTVYNNWNSIFLTMYSEEKNFSTPVFCTFNQAKEIGISILAKEKSFPVVYWNIYYQECVTKKRCSINEYNALSKEEKSNYKKRAVLEYYNVFNIDQTTYKDVYPEKYQSLIDRKNDCTMLPENNRYFNELIDDFLKTQTWDCPINIKSSDRAYYAFSSDFIVIPLKEQFEMQERFYSTLLHEMVHSTGHPERLNRTLKSFNMDKESYSIEELIAELSSAMIGSLVGISVYPSDDNIAYLKSWLSILKESPQFLFTILPHVNKAVSYISERIGVKEFQIQNGIEV